MDRYIILSVKKICCKHNLPVLTPIFGIGSRIGEYCCYEYSHLYPFLYYIQDPILGIAHRHPVFAYYTLQFNFLSYQFYRKMEYSNLQRQAAYMKNSLFDQVYLLQFFTSINLDHINDSANRNKGCHIIIVFFKLSSIIFYPHNFFCFWGLNPAPK